MNPLVSEMLGVSARNDLEIRLLEELLNDDCKCEAAHRYTPYCSGEAIYRVTCCRYTVNACKSVVEDPVNGTRVRMGKNRCAGCHEAAAECWEIRPI